MSNQKTSPGCTISFNIAIASVVALAGAFIVLISLNVIPANQATFHTPRLVVATARMVFLLMGGWVAFRTASPYAQDIQLYPGRQYTLLLAFMIAFVSVCLWVGQGPGDRQFSPVVNPGTSRDLLGRLLFAGSGVLAAYGTGDYAVFRGCRLLGREDARKSAPKEPPVSGCDGNRQG